LTASTLLEAIFRAERDLREAEERLMSTPDEKALSKALAAAVDEAAKMSDRAEASMRLERLSDLCAQVAGPDMIDAIVRILDDEEPSVRVAAGEALLDVGYERYAEVARGVERVLARNHEGLAMRELPWVLSEIGEPSALPLVRRFLDAKDGEVVASAIEALASLGDPDAIPALEKLVDDERPVTLEEEDEEVRTTVGVLAHEAIHELGGHEDEEQAPKPG